MNVFENQCSSVSAVATCVCYFLNMIMDVLVITTGNYPFKSMAEVKVEKLTGVITNCSDPINMYTGQHFDLGTEVIGCLVHVLAIVLALRSRKNLLNTTHKRLKSVKI